jgi:hypothetical protein
MEAKIIQFKMKISSSAINRNELKFQDLPKPFSNIIESNIYQLDLTLYHSNLTTELVSEYVFKKMSVMNLNGQISFIQNDLFKYFYNIRILRIKTENLRNLFRNNN